MKSRKVNATNPLSKSDDSGKRMENEISPTYMNDIMTIKKCTKCGDSMPLGEFRYRLDHGHYVHTSVCKACENKYKKEYHRTHKKEEAAYKRMCYQTNRHGAKDKSAVRNKKSYEEHKESRRASQKVYREKNKDKINIGNKNYYEKNKDVILPRQKVYYHKNHDAILARDHDNYLRKQDHIRARRKRWGKTPNGFLSIWNALRRRKAAKHRVVHEDWAWFELMLRSTPRVVCYWCGEIILTDGAHCHMDHIVAFDNNGPDAEYNIVPSCPSCNNSKRKKQPADYVAWRYKRGLPLHPQFLEPGGELKKAIEFKGGREYNYLPAL